MTAPSPTRRTKPAARAIGGFIFFSRWLQAPLYVGLIVAQLIYVVVFMVELWHLGEQVIAKPLEIEESVIMLSVLGLIDVVMIANLLIMVIIGGYETFVSRINLDGHPDEPEWLSHVNANVLKVKLAMAIIGISSIHLLKTFIEVGDLGATSSTTAEHNVTGETYTSEGVFWQVMIHLTFIISAVALALIDRWSLKHLLPAGGPGAGGHGEQQGGGQPPVGGAGVAVGPVVAPAVGAGLGVGVISTASPGSAGTDT